MRWFAVVGCSVTLLFFLSVSWSVSGLFRLGSIILPSWWNHSNEAGHSVVWQYPCIECALAFELQYSEAIKSWLRHTHTQKDNQLHWSKFYYSWLVIFSCTVNNFKGRNGGGKGGGREGEGSLNLTTAPYMFPTPTLSLPSPAGSPWKK